MADIRDWASYIRGRWNWTGYGYEQNLPRRSAFGDIDATLELNGSRLTIECKFWDGEDTHPDPPPAGQLRSLRQMARTGKVWLLYGCASCNNPLYLMFINPEPGRDPYFDWRSLPLRERRAALKDLIDAFAAWAEQGIGTQP